jgi:hypothetical protein
VKSERLWVVVLSLTWLLVGAAGGMLFSLQRNPLHDAGPFSTYQARLVEAYELDEVNAGRLAEILAHYDQTIERLKARQAPEIDAELVQAGTECMDRIHDYIVPAERREEFRLLARGRFVPAASAQ